ncbi:hypothetical protein CA267_015695 [Alteromonas pelagimontana]|uniref:Toxin CptA n=1 Tax=Alteromonas pelagimontana TaxID=1858656 RepID=A0A6M4MG43_9ALTE|nr:protein YgfX [Alteromonas pelagimontana]QJR82089.1 hypothetical protein CA267_015695 [Alteromonas pelagimontana]
MSKYRLSLQVSPLRRYAYYGPVIILGVALYLLPEPVWTWLSPLYLFLLFVPVALWCGWQHRQPVEQQPEAVQINQEAHWQVLLRNNIAVEEPYQIISRKSCVTFFAIYLCLLDQNNKKFHRWIMRGECSEQDYRRLVRQVLAIRQS